MGFARKINLPASQTLAALFLSGVVLAFAPAPARGAAIIASSTTFSPADPARTYMDRAGTWNGTTEVTGTTGDTFRFTTCNTAAGAGNTAFDIGATVTLPLGFSYVAGSAGGIPGLAPTQAGALLNFHVPAGTTISTNTCRTISYGLVTSTPAGTYPLTYELTYSTSAGGTQYHPDTLQNVLVESGAATIIKGEANQLKAVGDPVTWTVTVTNTGGGGLFGVSIDESDINPGPSISFTSLTQTAPALPASGAGTARLTLPYLASGEQFITTVVGQITGCSNLNNTARVDDRIHVSSASASTQVLLDLKMPLVDFSAPAIALNNLSTVTVTIQVNNTGHGAARNVVLGTTLNTFPVVVSNVAAGWSYDVASGSFTKTSNGGTIANSGSATLSFDLAPNGGNLCVPPALGQYFVSGYYSDVCGNPYANPVRYNSLSASYTRPDIGLSMSMPGVIVTPATNQNASVTITITRPDLVATNPIIVIDTLPANISSLVMGAATMGTFICPGGTCDPGETLTWTIPKPSGPGTVSYSIPYTFSVPTYVCQDRQYVTNEAVTSATSTIGCALSGSASASSLLTNTVSTGSYAGYTQGYGIAPGTHETGLPTTNLVRDPGEGEFIAIYSTYSFPATFTGTWTGTTYQDDYGGAGSSTMTLVPNSLMVSWDGGAAVAVPPASITDTAGQLLFSAAFLKGAGYLNSDSVAGHSVRFTYSVTASDVILDGNPDQTLSLTHFSDFIVGGGPIGACTTYGNTKIIQSATDSLARAKESLSLAMPPVVDVCQTFTATATISAVNFGAYGSSATILTAGNYTYEQPQTPVYGGAFSAGNISYSANSGVNPSFLYTGASLLGDGTIGVRTRRKAVAGTANSAISATGEYDDWQTAVTPARDFGTSASAAPILTRAGRLSLTTTPQSISITARQTEWKIYVNNTGSGGIYNAVIQDVVPDGLVINVSSTNAQNPGYPISSVSGSTVTWNLAAGALPIDIAGGGGITLTVFADVAPGVCSIPPNANKIPVSWGCDGVSQEAVTKNDLNLSFPSGNLQATHDSVNTFTKLCSNDYDTIKVRNTGLSHIYDAEAYEVLNTPVTGISFVADSVQVSTDSGSTWTSLGASGNPTGGRHTGE